MTIWLWVFFIFALYFGWVVLKDIYIWFRRKKYTEGLFRLMIFWLYIGILVLYYNMFLGVKTNGI